MEINNQPHLRPGKKEKASRSRKENMWIVSYIVIAVVFLTAYILLRNNLIPTGRYYKQLQKSAVAGFLATLILLAAKFIQVIVVKKSHSRYKRYNLLRLTHLLSLILVAILIISFLFANLYAAAVSLGLISLIMGFALQTPISSFIGWIYVIARNPYSIGDRIQINDFKGDVIEIDYLDTTLWEFAGDYLTNDLPSGRLIRFPNSLVLQSAVYNYSWKDFRYIWNEIPFHIAYQSNLDFVEKTIRKVTKDELGPEMAKRVEDLKELVKQSPIDAMEIKEYPFVSLRINANTWVEVMVTYLVSPKQAASVRSKIIKRVIAALSEQPDKTMFPKSDAR